MVENPEKIGKYKVLGVAGRGGMGIVYIGHDPFIDRKVAIKVCPVGDPSDASSRLARKMFFNEAQTAGVLDNPNILRVLDAGEVDGDPYIVMEFVEGVETLKDYCTPEKLIPLEQALTIFHQCAKALDYAHRRGVTHRDIKSANIMLNTEGDAKIGDFGIAQQALSDQTQVMGMFGSPTYMSPEQARDDDLTSQTDIYSFGVVMYEVLAGRAPFRARGFSGLLNKILNEEPTPISEFRPEVPRALTNVVVRAMCKRTTERYQTSAEIAADLAAIIESLRYPAQRRRELSSEDRFELARKLKFFNEFSDAEVEEVLDVAEWENFGAAESIISSGEAAQSFYIIIAGDVSVQVDSKQIASLEAGDCVGEMGYLADAIRSASVVAVDDVSMLKIDAALTEWASIPCQMRFNKAFIRVLINRLAQTSVRLAEYLN